MKSVFSIRLIWLLLFSTGVAFSQQLKFNRVVDGVTDQVFGIKSIAQDKLGYIWFSSFRNGMFRYDGTTLKSFTHDPKNNNSLANNEISQLIIDSNGLIWITTFSYGLDRYDPATNTFTHFRHNPQVRSSLANDSVWAVFQDHLGDIWVGSSGGLDKLDTKTGTFSHFVYDKNDSTSLSYNHVFIIYEDRQQTLWVGCGYMPGVYKEKPEDGGLNRFDRKTGKFKRYKHDPNDSTSIADNKLFAMYEDSKNNLWIGTDGDGLQKMDRATGQFIHYSFDPAHSGKLSPPPLLTGDLAQWNIVTLIAEDITGALWIGGGLQGLNRYDTILKTVTHYGDIWKSVKEIYRDTISGFHEPKINTALAAYTSHDGLLWIGTNEGNLYKLSLSNKTIPYFDLKASANSFYRDKEDVLWIATDSMGLIQRNQKTGIEKRFLHDPMNSNSLSANNVVAVRPDVNGNLWLGFFYNGVDKFDPTRNVFTSYKHIKNDPNSLSTDSVYCLYMDSRQNSLWIGTQTRGVDKLDITTGKFTHYLRDDKDTNSISNNSINCIDRSGNEIWIGCTRGINRLDQTTNRIQRYMKDSEILSICADSAGIVWVGTTQGFLRFDRVQNVFSEYNTLNSPVKIRNVLSLLEDNQHNLWVSTDAAILKINERRDAVSIFGKNYGIHANTFYSADNYRSAEGELFMGEQGGYYAFFPDQLKERRSMQIHINSFKMGDEEMMPGTGTVLTEPIWDTKQINLKFNQNVFSFDFKAIDYTTNGGFRYLFMLENYDDNWHDLGSDHKAYFFNVPAGSYKFRVKAINSEGIQVEKAISIIISPPWWRTWWAYTILALFFIGTIWGFIYYRSRALRKENRVLEEKVANRTAALNQSLKNLQDTQAQLVQREKMASLGELTAGIAHEIQNPLNFVNNFSEVSNELIEEMKTELLNNNTNEAISIAGDLKQNLDKINHHGKRADAIVKGMLQHSRSSSGIKELTDINALADEYLRLSYHGLRAKDKLFNAALQTDFDSSVGKINIVSQDIGRVLLNLYNNAFYAVNEKKKLLGEGYEPLISVSTKKIGDKSDRYRIEIKVTDNGNGIPQNIVDKIFQPFFTTKPTGQGTGLGLSLSYDIVKVHGGEIRADSTEGEGTTFYIVLPV